MPEKTTKFYWEEYFYKEENQTYDACIKALEEKYSYIYVVSIVKAITKYVYDKITKQEYDIISLKAVLISAETFPYLKNPSYDICKVAVMEHGDNLKHIKNQTIELCILAVSKRGYSLRYVKNQTEDICIRAVIEEGFAIEFVQEKFLTEKIILLAIATSPALLLSSNEKYKKMHITTDILKKAIIEDRTIFNMVSEDYQTQELCDIAIYNYPENIGYVKKEFQTEHLCIQALIKNINTIFCIEDYKKYEKIFNIKILKGDDYNHLENDVIIFDVLALMQGNKLLIQFKDDVYYSKDDFLKSAQKVCEDYVLAPLALEIYTNFIYSLDNIY